MKKEQPITYRYSHETTLENGEKVSGWLIVVLDMQEILRVLGTAALRKHPKKIRRARFIQVHASDVVRTK